MKVKLNRRERDSLLSQLRIAVAHQIELWDVTSAMAEQLGCELEEVTSRVKQPVSLRIQDWSWGCVI
jgi:hypothetical protein